MASGDKIVEITNVVVKDTNVHFNGNPTGPTEQWITFGALYSGDTAVTTPSSGVSMSSGNDMVLYLYDTRSPNTAPHAPIIDNTKKYKITITEV